MPDAREQTAAAARLPGEADILATVVADLRDETPRLVYADWLEERSDPRGAFLRKFVAAARGAGDARLPPSRRFPRVWRDVVGVTLIERLHALGLTDRRDALLGLARPTVMLSPKPAKGKALPVGGSRFGGLPDLPQGVAWPAWDKGPLGFLAQINLADLHGTLAGRDLPPRGLLSFFVFNDAEEGMPAPDKGSWQVLYAPDPSALRPHPAPDGLDEWNPLAPAHRLTFAETLDLPGRDSPWGDQVGIGLDRWEAYHELRLALRPSHPHLLGYSRVRSLLEDPIPGADWRHLITFDSDDDLGWTWGDGDQLYYFVRERDLRRGRFDATAVSHG